MPSLFNVYDKTRVGHAVARCLLPVMLLLSTQTVSAGYEQHPRFNEFANELLTEHQIPIEKTRSWLSLAEKQQSVLDAISRPAERTLEWDEYQDIFLNAKRIIGGKAFLNKYAETLAKVEQETGVPKEIITAIIGVETYYGRIQGNYRVLDSLATLAFDYPKRPLFWRELKSFFAMTELESMDVASVKGSYAGAMGYGQFIPSSYLAYAVDGDGDQRRDLWQNPVDAIASVANYFKRHGWRAGEPVTQPVNVEGEQYQSVVNGQRKPKLTAGDLVKLGVKPSQPIKDDNPATLMELKGKSGLEHWLGEYNFYVITRYNHSRMYAMAVYQLSQKFVQ